MLKKLLFLLAIIFNTILLSMEDAANITEPKNRESVKRQNAFLVLPQEIEEYILNFLIEETDDPIQNLIASNRLVNVKLVQKQWNIFIKNKIVKLVEKNNSRFKEKLISISEKANRLTKQDIKVLKCLLSIDNAITQLDKKQKWRILDAIFYKCLNHPNVLKLILKYVSNFDNNFQFKFIRRPKVKNGNNFLIRSVVRNSKQTVELILSFIRRFDVNKQMKILNARYYITNETPLIRATINIDDITNKHGTDVAELILNHISYFDIKKQLEIINATDRYSRTILADAIFLGNKKRVKWLMDFINKYDFDLQLAILEEKNSNGHDALALARLSRNTYPEIYNLIRNKKAMLDRLTNKPCIVS